MPDIGPVCDESGVLHGPAGARCEVSPGHVEGGASNPPGMRPAGATLIEILISLSIMAIGVLSAAAILSASHRQAELAARRGAEALAARQVLERLLTDSAAPASGEGSVQIGNRTVVVRVDTAGGPAGLRSLRASARATGSGTAWTVEVLVPRP